ncbi:hypothetical protein PRIPAC_92773 [Pristionchus pacificus]|uniref:Uncharacterized protein n=1 Tax=Pristionchus pacificus TaxID=54126 RepID=A0A2A6BQU3_PRIPA|nr:hypothetical protein PRIPAC_92773 [Pristionchus pacificus]|eukprot:PDM68131.1 hypothetical protein PRIPAC_46175 [Pristionchus pacificus]
MNLGQHCNRKNERISLKERITKVVDDFGRHAGTVKLGDTLEFVLLLDGVAVGGFLGGVDQLVGQALLIPFLVAGGDHRDGHPSFPEPSVTSCEDNKEEVRKEAGKEVIESSDRRERKKSGERRNGGKMTQSGSKGREYLIVVGHIRLTALVIVGDFVIDFIDHLVHRRFPPITTSPVFRCSSQTFDPYDKESQGWRIVSLVVAHSRQLERRENKRPWEIEKPKIRNEEKD